MARCAIPIRIHHRIRRHLAHCLIHREEDLRIERERSGRPARVTDEHPAQQRIRQSRCKSKARTTAGIRQKLSDGPVLQGTGEGTQRQCSRELEDANTSRILANTDTCCDSARTSQSGRRRAGAHGAPSATSGKEESSTAESQGRAGSDEEDTTAARC